MKEELYNKDIDEFVDWITGENSWTGQNVTEGLKVSGGSIRRLILKKLQKPFYVFQDTDAGLYRMFSSEESFRFWREDPEEYGDLELFNFVRPSDYEIQTDIAADPRYIVNGDSSLSAAQLTYQWDVRNDKSSFADSITAKYTITNANGKTISFTEIYSSTQKNVAVNLYRYLDLGQNTINVYLKAVSTGAIASATFIITVLDLALFSTFNYNTGYSTGTAIRIPFTLRRNDTSKSCSVFVYIDNALVKKVDIPTNSSLEYSDTIDDILNSYSASTLENKHVFHTLQMYAETTYNNSTFRSNLLHYTFETISTTSVTNYFINTACDVTNVIPPITELVFSAQQYLPFVLNWGYYTDQLQNNTSIPVTWKLQYGDSYLEITTITANKGKVSDVLSFIPDVYTTDENPTYIVAFYKNVEIARFAINISESDLHVYEAPIYALKLSAFGKTNSPSNQAWEDETVNVSTTFTNVKWDNNSGWYKNSLRLSGVQSKAEINYKPFDGDVSAGRTIEIDFEVEKVVNENDVVIRIGGTSGARIDITSDRAALYDNSGTERIFTNFKANERIKLAFIINEENDDVDSRLLFIINNGILERGASGAYNFSNVVDNIKIGESASGVRVYSIRIYNRALTYTDAYNNYVFDSEYKSDIINKNNVVDLASQKIDYNLCSNKLDTILISGDLSKILNPETDKDSSVTDVTIERFSPFDSSKNFKCEGCQIRKHGQSTLNYPITSMKFWLNKSVNGEVPRFTCEAQASYGYSKNRYVFKDGAIPANKFILQANYADSSGVHNGGLQRLIQKSWFDAQIDGQYRLRTIPQLFTTNLTIVHNNADLHEDNTVDGNNESGKQWGDYFTRDFPYQIQVSPDSTPCVVFYKDTAGSNTNTFLGQYVLMEDKKSDFNYGERSIYKAAPSDPFCLTIQHKDDDVPENKIWDNDSVLRMEVININTPFSSYMSMTDNKGIGFEDVLTDPITGEKTMYRWENDFEMIYPDPDDVAGKPEKGTDKFGPNSKFLRTAQPFINWYKWLISTRNNQEKFEAEAAQHIDLYKMAAYYVFMLRCGLVDSLERNAQIKTYDGVHFHYEPWDMDIAFGNKNTGGIAFNPPIDRTTTLPTDANTYAYSGRSVNTSNWLFDALESWDYWANILVPRVAQALYDAGFTYEAMANMFDEEYANKWCEIIYNESGYFKYVISRNADSWLEWLQGARTSHRHWWSSISMDYYDAKWGCGDFRNHFIYMAVNKDRHDTPGSDIIRIVPSSATYFSLVNDDSGNVEFGPVYSTKEHPAEIDVTSLEFSTKTPRKLYGALYVEDLDLSCLAKNLDVINIGSAYSSVLGAPLKSLNVGVPYTMVDDYHYSGAINGFNMSMSTLSNLGEDAFENLQTLNVRGQREAGFGLYQNIRVLNRSQLKNFYGMGGTFSTFYSSQDGNAFENIELPGINTKGAEIISLFTTLNLNNSTWNSISFWDGAIDVDNSVTTTRCNINGDYTLDIPSSLNSVTFTGTTCEHENSMLFVKKWMDCIVEQEGETGFANKQLILDGINWSPSTCNSENLLTFEDLRLLAKFNHGQNRSEYNTLKGYIVLNNSDGQLSSEQLTQIKEWFGDSVFNKNSSGLIIDQMLDYIRINVGADAYTIEDEVYLNEGHTATLSATKFALSEDSDTEFVWGLRSPGSSELAGSVYKGVQIEYSDDVVYINARESEYGNYDVEVVCSATNAVVNITPIIIHINGVVYPESYTIEVEKTADSTNAARHVGQNVTFWKSGIIDEFYLQPADGYNATITDVLFTLEDSQGEKLLNEVSCWRFKELNYTSITIDSFLTYRKTSTKDYGMTLACVNIPNDDRQIHYTLTAKVIFKSAKTVNVVCNIIVMDDSVVVLNALNQLLYTPVTALYTSLYGAAPSGGYYRAELSSLVGTLDLSNFTGTTLRGNTGKSILLYLDGITSLILDNSTSLLSEDNNIIGADKRTLVFNNMRALQNLSMEGCTALTEEIDLSNCTELLTLNLKDDTINAVLPVGTKLTNVHFGLPTQINLEDPTVITPANVTVTDSTNIDSVDITNIPGNKSFTMFAKIMNIS